MTSSNAQKVERSMKQDGPRAWNPTAHSEGLTSTTHRLVFQNQLPHSIPEALGHEVS